MDKIIQCEDCGKSFTFYESDRIFYLAHGYSEPKRCKKCRELRKKQAESKAWEEQKAKEAKIFERKIKEFPLVEMDEIETDAQSTLFVIGNGFDIAHGVKSSYYAFRDTLGKNNKLRVALEEYLKVDNLWADFENALAHLNAGKMLNRLDDYLDVNGAYDKDASASDFFIAVDEAIAPAYTIVNDLPRRLRMWIESLSVKTDERPYASLIKDAKVLNFNYTEFIEQLYGVSESNVCYIHGCRRKKKFHPKDKLIIGHAPVEEFDFDDDFDYSPRYKNNAHKRYMLESAYETAFTNLNYYDEDTTKRCDEIIKSHEDFFASLSKIKTVVVIGHSLSRVDQFYFREIIRRNDDPEAIQWYFGCHQNGDLENVLEISNSLKIWRYRLFKT